MKREGKAFNFFFFNTTTTFYLAPVQNKVFHHLYPVEQAELIMLTTNILQGLL